MIKNNIEKVLLNYRVECRKELKQEIEFSINEFYSLIDEKRFSKQFIKGAVELHRHLRICNL